MKIVFVLAGAIAGAIALSVLTPVFHWIFFRPALGDGQYVFVFMVTKPVGTILGAMTGLIMACLSRGETGVAGRIAVGGGGFLAVLFLLLGLFVFSGTEGPTILERLGATMFWFGLPLIWSALLIRTGLRILAGR